MATVLFDTHKAIKELQEAGFDEAQAEAVVATMGEVFTGNLATKDDFANGQREVEDIKHNMATKEDLADVQRDVDGIKQNMATKEDLADVQRDVDGIKQNMATKEDLADVQRDVDGIKQNMATKEDLKELEIRLMVRMGGFMIALAGISIAIMRLLD